MGKGLLPLLLSAAGALTLTPSGLEGIHTQLFSSLRSLAFRWPPALTEKTGHRPLSLQIDGPLPELIPYNESLPMGHTCSSCSSAGGASLTDTVPSLKSPTSGSNKNYSS